MRKLQGQCNWKLHTFEKRFDKSSAHASSNFR
jgi:hypothetical protein